MNTKRWRRLTGRLVLGSLTVLVTVLYVRETLKHARYVNTRMSYTDQNAYVGHARDLREAGYDYVMPRNRMPLYPLIQSLFLRKGMSDQEFFARGKRVNIVLSLVLLVGIYLVLRHYLPLHDHINLILITALTVWIWKAPYFQCELLYYFLFFCAFVLMLEFMNRPTWPVAVLGGTALGLAYLTKASVPPAFLLFLLVVGCRQLAFPARRGGEAAGWETPVHNALCLALLIVCFLIVVFNYVATSKAVFGRYFYNVNSTFYMWYDSWDAAVHGTGAHGDQYHWPTMPAEQIPSASKYFREHTVREVLQRLGFGLGRLYGWFTHSYGYAKYILLYSGFALLLGCVHFRHTSGLLRRFMPQAVFCALMFPAYIVLFAWFARIAVGPRFFLMLFLPYMFVLAVVIRQQPPVLLRFTRSGRHLGLSLARGNAATAERPTGLAVGFVTLFNWLVTLLLVRDTLLIAGGSLLHRITGE